MDEHSENPPPFLEPPPLQEQGRGSPPLQADEEAGNEALGSSLTFTLISDNWSPVSRAGGS